MVKVSIGLPVYNGENYVASAIEGVLSQTFRDLELVICDNASTDGTQTICERYAAQDPRVRYIRNETNIGAAPNFNKVFHEARGTYFAWKAHDDYYAPTWVEQCVAALDRDPSVVLAYSAIQMLDMENRPLSLVAETGQYVDQEGNEFMGDDAPHIAEQADAHRRFAQVLHEICWCLQVFGLARRDVLTGTALQRSYYGADKVLLADLALAGRFHQIEERLFYKRVHPKMSFFQTAREKREWIDPKGPGGIPQVYMVQDYLAGIRGSNQTLGQKAQCVLAIAQMFSRRQGIFRRIFVPGPDNYLGLNFGLPSRAKQLSK